MGFDEKGGDAMAQAAPAAEEEKVRDGERTRYFIGSSLKAYVEKRASSYLHGVSASLRRQQQQQY